MDQISPKSIRNRQSSSEAVEDDEEQTYGFQAQLQAFTKAVFGTCGLALEAASMFMQQQGCRWPLNSSANQSPQDGANPPLSIADELRRLAMREGRTAQPHGTRTADIPKFLGEDHVYSFEDDNISALSQHTLEEMARHGVVHPSHRRRPSSVQSNNTPPSPAVTTSLSSSSSKDRRIRQRKSDDIPMAFS